MTLRTGRMPIISGQFFCLLHNAVDDSSSAMRPGSKQTGDDSTAIFMPPC